MRCCLCTIKCTKNFKSLYDKEGFKTEFCHVLLQYFAITPSTIDNGEDKRNKCICIICWKHIIEFYNFQQTIQHLQAECIQQLTVSTNDIIEDKSDENMANIEIDIDKDASLDLYEDLMNSSDAIVNSDVSNKPNKRSTHYKIRKDLSKKTHDADNLIAKVMGNSLTCVLCNENCVDFSSLRKHFLTTHSTKPYIFCCSIKFTERQNLADHLQTHINPNIYKCETCDKRCMTRKILRLHCQNHEDHKCKVCEATFTSALSLRWHMDEHVGTVPHYNCEQCDAVLPTDAALQRHVHYKHKKYVNPVMCEECGAKLATPQTLTRHKLYCHRGPEISVSCHLCNKTVRNTIALREHYLRIHKTNKPRRIKCDNCMKEFKSHSSLQLHQTCAHKTNSTSRPRFELDRCQNKLATYTSEPLAELFLETCE